MRLAGLAEAVLSESTLATAIGEDGNIAAYDPHDFPWTCDRDNARCELGYPYVSTSTYGIGDARVDDRWLSQTESEGGTWRQVACLRGSFLNYANANLTGIGQDPITHERVPSDAPAGRAVDGLANDQFVPFHFATRLA